ncbi:uncharacterized protein LOC114518986 [Dendronephthya gigantea]|uniref:uncharacterized protein LOC114518986 n=1 Tax=Dendronephthya gigantea TaxID=151771 RepID=UPI00106C8A17|nr:uncharacterized protein LOC114518986 [Dendronephthya gigantea]XP_028394839.1 uncharacterized protein LOC114518986 [Dendronephthya gigantea]
MRIRGGNVIFIALLALLFFVTIKLFKTDYQTCTPISDPEKLELSKRLQTLAKNILKVQEDFEASSHNAYLLGFQLNRVNDILKLLDIDQNPITKPKAAELKALKTKTRKEEVCPEIYAGDDLGYGAPYYRKGYARVKCHNFVPINELLTLLMYIPHEHPKPAMSYLSMMTTISNDYPEVQVILATEKELNKDTVEKISSLKIKFKNEVIKGNKGSMWAKLLEQVSTPYVLIAPYLTHFDDDIDLYRLVRVLSYRDDVSVAGGSYRNLTGHWDLGCRQLSFNYWTAKYTAGYYRSFNECVVCDYLAGPFVAKTEWLQSLKIDASLSEGLFHDLFWRFKKQQNLAVVCADVMFNMDTPFVPNEALVDLANKHNIKKIVSSDGTVKWYGCRRGLNYTNKTGCSWKNGIGVPPCDLWNLGELVKFVMQVCEDSNMFCEYAAGDLVGAFHFGSTRAWGKNAEIYFETKDFNDFNKLRAKFESAGFVFQSNKAEAGLGSITISTTNWKIIMYGRKSLEIRQMVQQNQLPTKIRLSGAWITVPRNPGMIARGHFLESGRTKYHDGETYSTAAPAKCPNPDHSACLHQYPAGGNVQFLDNMP